MVEKQLLKIHISFSYSLRSQTLEKQIAVLYLVNLIL